MTQIKAIVIDDEKLARDSLLSMLEEFENIEVTGQCSNGFEAVKMINEKKPDLVFLDIQMPRLDGFEVLELLEINNLAVVFVTAFEQYALKAFETDAVDYILKPFSKERLEKAIIKVEKNLGATLPDIVEMKKALTGNSLQYLTRIVVKDGINIYVIPIDEVSHITAEDDYISIYTENGSLLKHQTLSSLEATLDPEIFIRIHRSTIINISKISTVSLLSKDKYIAVMSDGTELNISRTGYKRLKELM
ncbi:MAG: response regulator [Deltaproteobacteria bacterium]|nr:response regulator [Deltaproteobacteria bacterium]